MELSAKATMGLSSLSLDQSKQFGKKPTMKQAGEAFESLFMQTMMKSMRDAKIEGGLFDDEGEKQFQSMLDNLYSEMAVKKTKLGLGDAIARQFEPKTAKSGADPLFPKPPGG